MFGGRSIFSTLIAICIVGIAMADEGSSISDEQLAFFESRIRPVLVEKCYACHSAEAEELEGDLLVDSRDALRKGGAGGPAVVPGDPRHSLLVEAIRFENPDLQMPPEGKLADTEIADLIRWVEMGAPDPRLSQTKHASKKIDLLAAREFWSLRPIAVPPVPIVENDHWSTLDIDRFVLAELERNHLAPAPAADKRVLIRRATYDLTGLPPTPSQVANFLADESDDAYSKLLDRLLDSPRYGERWGRHWLDVVRYADTAGDNSDFPIPQNYRYRDWVIDAFNRDLPYDEFVRDQLAGDLRGGATEAQRHARLIATGYIAGARRFGSRVVDYPQHLTIEDTLDNLGRTFLGMTISCARCHDHKFDPITAQDYYGLYGVFHSTRYPWPGIELDQKQRKFVPLVESDRRVETEKELAAWLQEQTKLSSAAQKLKEQLEKSKGQEAGKIKGQLEAAEKSLAEHRQQAPQVETVYAVVDAEVCEDVALQLKGDPARLGETVERHFPSVLGGEIAKIGASVSGREELAEWILSEANPLPARVMVNRIWQYHFGRGLVPTPNDFGKQGKPPTHPQLLDYLAAKFRSYGWSIKSMHREIMLSSTYRQSSHASGEAIEQDPENLWLSCFPRQRLEAEAIRDTLLVLGENLELSVTGPHPFPPPSEWKYTQHNPFKDVYESNQRSVYLMTQRIQRHPYLAIFDGADPSTSTATRMTTTTPIQALYLMNAPLIHEQSQRFAQRICDSTSAIDERVELAYQMALSRPPQAEELEAARSFVVSATTLLADAGIPAQQQESEAWQAWVRTLFRLNEFVYLD